MSQDIGIVIGIVHGYPKNISVVADSNVANQISLGSHYEFPVTVTVDRSVIRSDRYTLQTNHCPNFEQLEIVPCWAQTHKQLY